MLTQTYTAALVIEHCYKCGIPFGMERSFQAEKSDNGGTFYCPNGHGQVYGKSEVQRLQQELAREKENTDYYIRAKNNLHEELTQQKYKTRAEKAAKTRLFNRVHAGVCPCCTRSFKNVARHMASEHPSEFKREASALHKKITAKV